MARRVVLIVLGGMLSAHQPSARDAAGMTVLTGQHVALLTLWAAVTGE